MIGLTRRTFHYMDQEVFRLLFTSNQIKLNQVLFSHTYNLQYVHFIKSDVM